MAGSAAQCPQPQEPPQQPPPPPTTRRRRSRRRAPRRPRTACGRSPSRSRGSRRSRPSARAPRSAPRTPCRRTRRSASRGDSRRAPPTGGIRLRFAGFAARRDLSGRTDTDTPVTQRIRNQGAHRCPGSPFSSSSRSQPFRQRSPRTARPASQASTLCKQQRTAVGTTAFKLLYGGSANAYGRCVSKLASTVQSDNANASKQCAAERADTAFAAVARRQDVRSSSTARATHGNNAFGKCVSTEGEGAHRRPAGCDDRRRQDVQGRAHPDGRDGLHDEVRRPRQRLRQVRLEAHEGGPVTGYAQKGAPRTRPFRPGRGAFWRPSPKLRRKCR